jgi:ATP-binding cassette, subfamily C (CFTR/MRP), member 1
MLVYFLPSVCLVENANHRAVVHLLPFADHIVALGRNGEVMEQGTFDQLSSKDGYVQSLSIKEADASSPTTDIESEPASSILGSNLEMPLDCNITASSRQLGDMTVYWYYFKATGLISALIFLIAELIFTTLEYFPCESLFHKMF